ncbi:Metallo-peptidase family M12-domain-containing protein [Dichotomocladium elegans]|nr:Metallo-peptidase family M12-domain-containing protein [Dichotomocladium elegans]
MSRFTHWCVQLVLLLLCVTVSAHSVNDRRLTALEPLPSVAVDIAPRPERFFSKRQQTRNPAYTPQQRPSAIEHDDILRLTVSAFNQTYYLHLQPNTDLFHPNAVLNHDGKEVRINPQHFRVYRGHVIAHSHSDDRWAADRAGIWRDDFSVENEEGVLGWARVVIRDDLSRGLEYPVLEGSFRTHDDLFHIKATHNYQLAKREDDTDLDERHHLAHMVIYRDSDTVLVKRDGMVPRCGFDPLIHGRHHREENAVAASLRASDLGIYEDDKIHRYAMVGNGLRKRAPAGCPSTKKINYMGAAADCTYTKYYQTANNARSQIINDWNTASAVYESTFNVQLGLINITIMDAVCPSTPSANARWNQGCSTAYDISSRLSDFSQWRASIGNDGAGLWHLMTSCASGVEVGIAWLGSLCTTTAKKQPEGYVSGTAVSSIIRDEWTVVAHEIGHNFGAIHDCTSDTCPCNGPACSCCPLSSTQCDAGGTYIMNPSSNKSTSAFSPCTIEKVCSAYPTLGTCLEDPGSRTIKTLQMCGNGIKEDGEDCDTGGTNTTCCNGSTCKYIGSAKCEDSTDLCCSQCQFKAKDTVCRSAASECDTQEVCSGTSGDCPPDTYKTDGSSCSNNMQCASGQCTSRDAQCRQRGTSMNVTRSCTSMSGSCELICDRPGGLGCLIFNGNFLDGTPCGLGGTCKGGTCSMDNFGDNAKNWIMSHLAIAIPVICVVGLLLLFCIIRCCFFRRRAPDNNGVYVISSGNAGPPPQYPPPYYPPPPSATNQQWVDPRAYNGMPSMPPPTYTQTHEAYEMQPAHGWQGSTTSNHRESGDGISGRVRRFEENRMGTSH